MCNPEFTDRIRSLIEELITHTDSLRLRFNDVQESYREGNLGEDVLAAMNQAVHQLETDSGEFERLLEA
ncbi:MAG: hypothetical protein C4534_06355 [Gaiellales bacterium]|nr:MAG: hypothetical protein C4534_06355 [Gaiellales bacterium]